MIIQCESCSRKFIVKDNDIPKEGRAVRCGYCSVTWHQMPAYTPTKNPKKQKTVKSVIQNDDAPSVDSIKASDGKTYKFLGGQWAELFPSGKTGLFAKKKISQELDKITGRKVIKTPKKKKKKVTEVNPSAENINEKKLPDIYKPKEGLGFFGYIFLLIIIGFSIVGVLKTFENDLISYFPEITYIFELLDEQLGFFSETVKNMIVIFNDLIGSY
tara:strand:- start:440 stop:1084 length:645 start_codon:yes stop_codon:yes gene_type:complete